jgi:16S rRNA (cytidine1402-2'-O)-methyltransferase
MYFSTVRPPFQLNVEITAFVCYNAHAMNKNLYIVATPIGNLSDMTFRAVETLKSVDVILCEDTRETLKLLKHFNFEKHLISLHQHTSEEKVKSLLNQFDNIAYASDAGTPGISDPGNKLVEAAVSAGFKVIPIPCACAAVAALSVSGLPTDKFLFMGFLPQKGRTAVYEKIKNADVTVCFYESPHRSGMTLEQLKTILTPARPVMVARELTKMFETIYRGNIVDVAEAVRENERGEFVVVVGEGAKRRETLREKTQL